MMMMMLMMMMMMMAMVVDVKLIDESWKLFDVCEDRKCVGIEGIVTMYVKPLREISNFSGFTFLIIIDFCPCRFSRRKVSEASIQPQVLVTQTGGRSWIQDGNDTETEPDVDINIIDDMAEDSFDLDLDPDDEYDTDLEMDIDGKCCLPLTQTVSQPTSQSLSRPVSQHVRLSLRQSVTRPISQSVTKIISESAGQLVSQSDTQSICNRVNKPVSQSVCQLTSQSGSLSINQSVSQTSGYITHHAVRQSANVQFTLWRNRYEVRSCVHWAIRAERKKAKQRRFCCQPSLVQSVRAACMSACTFPLTLTDDKEKKRTREKEADGEKQIERDR